MVEKERQKCFKILRVLPKEKNCKLEPLGKKQKYIPWGPVFAKNIFQAPNMLVGLTSRRPDIQVLVNKAVM